MSGSALGVGAAPHAAAAAAVAADLDVDPVQGLSEHEAAARLLADGPNELAQSAGTSWQERVLEQFVDPLVGLLLLAIAISVVAWVLDGAEEVPFDAIAIAAIVVLNAGIGVVQANRADAAVAALRELSATQAQVVRDGRIRQLPAGDVVVGDVLVFNTGDAIAADARLIEVASLRVAEASLTGESEPVDKTTAPVTADAAVGDRRSMVHAGTAAVAGRGRAVVVATGMHTQVGQVAALLEETERFKTPLEQEIGRVGRLLGGVVIAIAVIVVATMLVVSDIESASDVVDALLVGVSLAVAAVPEGLPAVLSIVLAIGVQRMARRNALVKRLASAETLGAATTICTDKTGTLTRGEMTVRAVIAGGRRFDLGGTGYAPEGGVTIGGHPADGGDLGLLRRTLRAGALASDASIVLDDDTWLARGDPTEAAVVAAAVKTGTPLDTLDTVRRLDEIGFSSDRKRMSVLVDDPREPDEPPVLLLKGAPDLLLARCDHELTGEGAVPLTEERRAWWRARIDELADEAMRTLAIATRPDVAAPLHEDDETEAVLMGVLGIIDPPRIEAYDAVADARRSGVRVIMITGDHPRTAAQIAADLGIIEPGGPVMSGVELEALDDEALAAAVDDTVVFARVAPAHKLRLVRALQARGEVVAMTGDGVNDAPALKAADLGTAMGVAGTDVAREAADMILTDDNFATIVVAIREGRGIFHNIRSFLRYLLGSNVGEVLTVFLGIVFAGLIGLDGDGLVAPLTATQILWINLLTDTGPALALGVDPPDPHLMTLPPRSQGDRVIDGPMRRGIAVVGLTMAVVTLAMFDGQRPGGLIEGDASLDEARTAAFTVLVLAQLFNCFSARSDYASARVGWAANRWLLAAAALAVGLQVAVVHLPFMNDAFSTAPLSPTTWIVAFVLASAVLWVNETRKWLRRRGPALEAI